MAEFFTSTSSARLKVLLIGILLFGSIPILASAVTIGIRLGDNSCTSGHGAAQYGTWGNWSGWATDSDGSDPDCMALYIANDIGHERNVRIGIQAYDRLCDPWGCWNDYGSEEFTPWASDGGGWSGYASDSDQFDPDGYRIVAQEGGLSGRYVTGMQLGLQLTDLYLVSGCWGGSVSQQGYPQFTPWNNGWTNWAVDLDGLDFNCARVHLNAPVQNLPPACHSFSVNTTYVGYPGGNVYFSWDTSHASYANISYIGNVGADGGGWTYVPGTRTYTLTAYGPGGSTNCGSITVTVAGPPAPTCHYFNVSPTSHGYPGGNSYFWWNTSNANYVYISNVGNTLPGGGGWVYVPGTRTYQMWAYGPGGTSYCGARTVYVADPPPTCDAFSASPSQLPYGGGNTNLTWYTSNANSVSINQGVGGVPVDGSRTVFTSSSKTYTLYASGPGGGPVTCSVGVGVDSPSATLQVRNVTDGTGWQTHNLTIDAGDEIALNWSSNTNSCNGLNFSTGGAGSGSQYTVDEPYAGTQRTYQVSCDGATDQILVTTNSAAPSLTTDETLVPLGTEVDFDWDTNFNDPASCSFSGPEAPGSVSDLTGSFSATINGAVNYAITCPGGTSAIQMQIVPQTFES